MCENYPNLFLELYSLQKPLICNCIEPLLTEFPSIEGYFLIETPGSLCRALECQLANYKNDCVRVELGEFAYSSLSYYSKLKSLFLDS
jgi:hypothetical protein